MRLDGERHSKWPSLILLLLGAVLGACGTDVPTGQATQTLPSVITTGTPTAGLKTCTGCHDAETADWMLSKHANVKPIGDLYSQGNPTLGMIAGQFCVNCHDPLGDSAGLTSGKTGNVPRPVVGCESCHGGGALHVAQGGVGPIGFATTTAMVIGTTSTLQVSAQFRTCTFCHQLLDSDNPASAATATPIHSAASATPPIGTQYIITDTHFATAGSWLPLQANTNTITGYAMNYASETVCSNCHNPHQTADINREWFVSAHADTSPTGAWAHFNWTCNGALGCGGLDARLCQRCHTTTGFSAYANALQSGNIALATAIQNGSAPPLSAQIQFKPEMLECNGCHSDDQGRLRNPGAYNATYSIATGTILFAAVTYQYPDVTASNVCMPCHTGRDSGRALQALNTGQTATIDFGNLAISNVDGHNLTAGGTMFKGTGYEYAGRDYSNPSTYMHSQIGTPAQPGTGTNGPCVGCHMDRTGLPGNHLFQPVSTASGSIVVTSEVCFKCHAGSSTAFGAVVEDESNNYAAALQALQQQLSAAGYPFLGGYPFFSQTNWLLFGDTDASGKNTIGAAFNFLLLSNEPGAYVHNSRYTKRLIYDSVDWLDDGVLNYSVGTTLANACNGAPQPWCAGAKSYLLYGAPNTSGERP